MKRRVEKKRAARYLRDERKRRRREWDYHARALVMSALRAVVIGAYAKLPRGGWGSVMGIGAWP